MDNHTNSTSSIDMSGAACLELLKEIQNERDEDYKDCPNFLLWDWNDMSVLKDNGSIFMSILSYNSLFPDMAITKKLHETECLYSVTKWIVTLESITRELEVLANKYPLINIDAFAYYSIAFITLRTQKAFVGAITKDKSELNFTPVTEKYFLQRRKSPNATGKGLSKMGQLAKAFIIGTKEKNTKEKLDQLFKDQKDPIGKMIEMVIQSQVVSTSIELGRKKAMKQLIGAMGLESYAIMRLLPIDELELHYKKSELYRDLYPLFKLILKDKDLLSEEEHSKDLKSRYYNIYKVNQVKIILGRTRSKAKN